ncbi:MAG: hypothetical protein KTR15_05160 [Phycisphaeraceae bacterium]|nr:hypothetical protein [Phycisphaeraceae bacterium]
MKRTEHNQHGFALLLTLVLLMIGGVALAHVARQSAGEALHALEAREELQRRWAVTSCRETLLPRAPGLLTKAAQGPVDAEGVPLSGRRRVPTRTDLRVSCELAGLPYDIVLTDEQAKFNPTALGAMAVEEKPILNNRALRRVVHDLAGFRNRSDADQQGSVVLRPLIGVDTDGKPIEDEDPARERHDVYSGYGQLFEGVSPQTLVGDASRRGVASRLTCWGDGRLNMKRAPDEVVRQTLKPLLGQEGVLQLLDARAEAPGLGASDLMQAVVNAEPAHKAFAAGLLTDTSQVQGLWVVAHGRGRSWHSFSVRERVPQDELEEAEEAALEDPPSNDTEAKPEPISPFRRYDFAW